MARMKQQGPSAYTVFDLGAIDMDGMRCDNDMRGNFETLDEALGCVEFDGLTVWEIWLGDRIVAESHPVEVA